MICHHVQVLTLFPPIAEQMMAHEQAINDALARNNTIAFAVDEVREMVMTKAEKTSVDQARPKSTSVAWR